MNRNRCRPWGAALVAALTLLALQPASAGAVPRSDPQAFHALLESWWSDWLRLNPALALTVGDYSNEERFDDSLEDSWRARALERLHHYSSALAAIDPNGLESDARLSYDMLRYQLERDLGFYGSHLFEVARMLPVDHQLAAGFDIRSFHEQILLGGSMPLAILERKIKSWLDATQSK